MSAFSRRFRFPIFLLACLIFVTACARAESVAAPRPSSNPSSSFPELPAPVPTPTSTPSATVKAVPSGSNRVDLPGQLLYVKDNHIYLWYYGESTKLTVDARNSTPSWLPDGQSFVFTRWSRGFSDLYRYYFDGRPIEALTRNDPAIIGRGAWAAQPVVSPNGRQIVYISDRSSGVPALWTIDLANKAARQLITDPIGESGVQDPAWRPDGSGVLAVFSQSSKSQVWSFRLGAGQWNPIISAPDGVYSPALSPSGDWIAYTERRGTANDVFVSRPDGKNPIQVTTDGHSRTPLWAGDDGSTLIYVGRKDNTYDLFAIRIDLNTGQPRTGLVQQLTRGVGVDPGGGLSWIPRES